MGHRTWSSRLARGVVAAAAPLVPRTQREAWRAEWEGELAAVGGDDGATLHRLRRSPLAYAMGAPADAAWMRQRAIADLTLIDDLRHGWRQLWQQALVGLTAIGILALGMAASVTAFSVVSQLLLRPLPYPDPDRIVTLWERRDDTPAPADVAPGNFLDWRDRATTMSALAGAEPYSYDYTGGDRPEVLRAVQVTEGFFDIFGLPPVMGRYFRPDEHSKGANQVVVISARLWRSHFGADPDLVGRAIPLDEVPYTVVGIVPDDFQPHLLEDLPGQTAIWTAKAIEDYEPNIRTGGYWQVVGRLAEGQTLEAANAELDTIARQIETERPRTNTGSRVQVMSLREHLVGDVRAAVTLFAWAVGAVLLIACVNVTNLLLARGAVRQHELSIRTALGASRSRLVAQLLTESLLLSAISGLAALLLAIGAVRLIAAVGPRTCSG